MLLGAIIWGASFVVQRIGVEFIGPFTFGCIRFLLGALSLLPIYFILNKGKEKGHDAPARHYIISGIVCGGALFIGASFQQFGIMLTTAGKAGFITSLYVVLVPIFALLVFRKHLSKKIIIAIIISLIGIYLLCVNEGFSINTGDVYNFIGAIFWAIQILAIEKLAYNLDGVKFAIIQFLVCGVLSGIFMFILEKPTFDNIGLALLPLLYSGILSVGVGFTAQIICINYTDPIVASLIMSSESVFSVIFGFLLLGEVLTTKQGIGCILVLSAVILAQITPKRKKIIT